MSNVDLVRRSYDAFALDDLEGVMSYVLSTGRLVLEGPAAALRENEDLRKAYLGR